jgi:hypothetical protein
MSKAKAPADGDGFHEELVRRNKESEWKVWFGLVAKHIFPEKDGIHGLVLALLAWQSLKFENPELIDLPVELIPVCCEIVSQTKEMLDEACRKNDSAFLRRLLEASILIDEGNLPDLFNKLTIMGFALMAWRQLYDELGARLSLSQLKDLTDELRRQDRVVRRQDRVDEKISNRRWKATLEELGPLLFFRE